MSSSHLFKGVRHAQLYSQYRPQYPASVINSVINYCKKSVNEFNLAIDVGCGSGQSTMLLSKHFQSVIGCDISKAQIEQAQSDHTNVSFRVSPAEDLTFQPSQTVDLVTVAQAAHWLDLNKFYSEVFRVLQPGGVLAMYGYGMMSLDNSKATEDLLQFYSTTLGKYWDDKRKHIEEKYKGLDPPEGKTFDRDDSLILQKSMPLSGFVGYVSSWSAYMTLLKENPDSKVLEDLHKRLLASYGEDIEEDPEVSVTWPLFILMCRKDKL